MQEVPYEADKKPRKVVNLVISIGSFVFSGQWHGGIGKITLDCSDTHAKYVNELVTESPSLKGSSFTTD